MPGLLDESFQKFSFCMLWIPKKKNLKLQVFQSRIFWKNKQFKIKFKKDTRAIYVWISCSPMSNDSTNICMQITIISRMIYS